MMKCGHAANAIRMASGSVKHDPPLDCCTICDCIEIVETPDLTGRVARCCNADSERPSSTDLAFFEYRGPGSKRSMEQCECGYLRIAHDKPHVQRQCEGFTPRGPFQYDTYYCGCRGWD
jgi:hypothetical protein